MSKESMHYIIEPNLYRTEETHKIPEGNSFTSQQYWTNFYINLRKNKGKNYLNQVLNLH